MSSRRPFSVILDVQGFIDDYGNLIPKEISWITSDHSEEMHAILEPPCTWNTLTTESRIINKLLTQQKHGLPWELAGIKHERLKTFYTFPPEADRIFVYNEKTAELLKEHTYKPITSLSHCMPSLSNIEHKASYCHYHQQLINKDRRLFCTRVNVIIMRQFLQITQILPDITENPIKIGQETQGRPYAHPEFAHREARLCTFVNWVYEKVKPEKLAEKGLFYTGKRDHVKCFACGTEIGMWLPNDDIEIRHHKANANCRLIGIRNH